MYKLEIKVKYNGSIRQSIVFFIAGNMQGKAGSRRVRMDLRSHTICRSDYPGAKKAEPGICRYRVMNGESDYKKDRVRHE